MIMVVTTDSLATQQFPSFGFVTHIIDSMLDVEIHIIGDKELHGFQVSYWIRRYVNQSFS